MSKIKYNVVDPFPNTHNGAIHFFHLSNPFQVAKLTNEDTIAVNNLRMLGGEPDAKKTLTGAFALKFDMHKVEIIYCLNV